jgi:hypothetical protein
MYNAASDEISAYRAARPVFRLSRLRANRWIVLRPGGLIEHGFPDLAQAVAFVRAESDGAPVTVELRIGELYAVAHLEHGEPESLFGE